MPYSISNPLTLLKDDESLFYNSVLDFAKKEIAPLVSQMDESETLNASLISKIFDMGLMAIEVPEKYGGSGGSFFPSNTCYRGSCTSRS